MQSIGWYYRRLRSMSGEEIAWRAQSAIRDATDRWRLAIGSYGPPRRDSVARTVETPFALVDVTPGAWKAAAADALEQKWAAGVTAAADRIAARRLKLFQYDDLDLGNPIDWNRDYESGRRAPMTFASSIDYRDHSIAGDCKLVWEPNRHQQMVVLGRAYRATADSRYAAAAVEQIESWMTQCPFGRGMNWRSPLELAIRAINWVWLFDLIRPSAAMMPAFQSRFLDGLHLHVWEIARKYSRESSANNHVIGEAAGVFIATSCFPDLPDARRLAREARDILMAAIHALTYADGCTREQAFAYHLFSAQFFLLAGIVARRTHADFPPEYWARLERMVEFAAAMIEAGPLPMVGDADDGYVLDLDGSPLDPSGLIACGAILFERSDFRRIAGGYQEAARWLLGEEGRRRFEALGAAPDDAPLQSRAFPDSGYYLLQSGHAGRADAISVLFDCGELGFGAIAAHGHADALSVTVRALDGDVLVDPGTYDYFAYPDYRAYYRSTRAHNTVMVDGADQSVAQGPFLWGFKARARCLAWDLSGAIVRVQGEHDGYRRLPGPVLHVRTVELDREGSIVTIVDDLSMQGTHAVEINFHFAERCELESRHGHRFAFRVGSGGVVLELDPRLDTTVARGCESPIGGWVSRGYHRKTPSDTISGRMALDGDARLVTRLVIARG